MKPKIYCLFTDRPVLAPSSGDKINEINFYRALSTFADVYYNDQLIDWSKDEIGGGADIKHPSRKYDLYYVRANAKLFLTLPHPKITLAYPYCPECFKDADAVAVTTNGWMELLQQFNDSPAVQKRLSRWYPDKIIMPKNLINVRQTVNPLFFEASSSKELFVQKAKLSIGFGYGFFGRLSRDTLPLDLIKHVGNIPVRVSDNELPLTVLAGPAEKNLTFPARSLYLGSVDYSNMPALNKSCKVILGQNCPDSDFLGSGKVLDAMASGTPVICRKNAVRLEQCGEEYQGHYETEDEGRWLINTVYRDPQFLSALSEYSVNRSNNFSPKNNGIFIREQLQAIDILAIE